MSNFAPVPTGFEHSDAELIELARTLDPHDRIFPAGRPIAGSRADQVSPEGVNNPLWEIVRHQPTQQAWRSERAEPDPFHALMQKRQVIGRDALCRRFSWSIPSPGDMRWLKQLLGNRGVVEIGAGTGYWAWQLSQVGIDVVAYDPLPVGPDNRWAMGGPYYAVQTGDSLAVERHSDRALLLCWPPYATAMAAVTLAAYRGDLLVYVGEPNGGCTGDDDFFKLLNEGWDEVGESPWHVSWSGIHCYMTAYRRRTTAPA